MTSYAYLSCSQQDELKVKRLREELSCDYHFFYNDYSKGSSEDNDIIPVQLSGASVIIACISAHYLASSQCIKELYYAGSAGKPILLVYIEDIQLPENILRRVKRSETVKIWEPEYLRKISENPEMSKCVKGNRESTIEEGNVKRLPNIWLILAVLFSAFIYTLIVFSLQPLKTPAFLTAYAFTLLAFIVLLLLLLAKNGNVKQYPMFSYLNFGVTVVFFIVQLILGIVVPVFLPALAPMLVFLIGVLLAGIYIVVLLISKNANEKIAEIDENDYRAVSGIRRNREVLTDIINLVNDPAEKKRAQDLQERIRYIEPSNDISIRDLDSSIEANLRNMRDELENKEYDLAYSRIDKVSVLLTKRNERLAALKH